MRALAMIAVAATLVAAACSDGPNDPKPTIAGTYVLQSVNGQALPYIVPGETAADEFAVTAGSIVLTNAGTFVMSESIRFTSAGSSADMTLTGSGTYTAAGGTLTFTVSDPELGSSSFVGTLSDRTLTIADEGEVWVFRR